MIIKTLQKSVSQVPSTQIVENCAHFSGGSGRKLFTHISFPRNYTIKKHGWKILHSSLKQEPTPSPPTNPPSAGATFDFKNASRLGRAPAHLAKPGG